MSSAPAEEPIGQVAPHGLVRFTGNGEAALDTLASRLAAECGDTSEGIAQVLDRILAADVSELAAELTAVDETTPAQVETPDEAARRRLGQHREWPAAGDDAAQRAVNR